MQNNQFAHLHQDISVRTNRIDTKLNQRWLIFFFLSRLPIIIFPSIGLLYKYPFFSFCSNLKEKSKFYLENYVELCYNKTTKLKEGRNLWKLKIHGLQKLKEESKIQKIIEFVLSSRWFVLFLGIIILLKTIFFYRNTVFKDDTIWLWSIRQTCFFIVIIVFPLLLFRKSVRRFEFGIVIDVLISILLFADELYYTYASNILSVMQVREYAI